MENLLYLHSVAGDVLFWSLMAFVVFVVVAHFLPAKRSPRRALFEDSTAGVLTFLYGSAMMVGCVTGLRIKFGGFDILGIVIALCALYLGSRMINTAYRNFRTQI